eukprot:95051_1
MTELGVFGKRKMKNSAFHMEEPLSPKQRKSICDQMHRSMRHNIYRVFGITFLVFMSIMFLAWNSQFSSNPKFSVSQLFWLDDDKRERLSRIDGRTIVNFGSIALWSPQFWMIFGFVGSVSVVAILA